MTEVKELVEEITKRARISLWGDADLYHRTVSTLLRVTEERDEAITDRHDEIADLRRDLEVAEAELSALRGEVEKLAEIAQHGAADKPIGSGIWHAEIDRLSSSLLSTLKGEELSASQSQPIIASNGDPQARLSDGKEG